MKKTSAAAAAAMAVLLGAGDRAFGQAVVCGAPANCTIAGMTRTCTEMWVYGLNSMTIPGGYSNTLSSATGAATNCTVMGNISTRTFLAQRPTTAGTTAACNFAGFFNFGGGTNSYVCSIDQAGGLPVELMEFSVEEETASSAVLDPRRDAS